MLVTCEAPECAVRFTPVKHGDQEKRFCSQRCSSRIRHRSEKNRRREKEYRQTHRRRYVRLVRSAKDRNLSVQITEQQYAQILESGCCFYCGELFDEKTARTNIDRYDRSVGYVFENCRACCWRCNDAKGSLERWFSPERSIELLSEIITGGRLVEHIPSK